MDQLSPFINSLQSEAKTAPTVEKVNDLRSIDLLNMVAVADTVTPEIVAPVVAPTIYESKKAAIQATASPKTQVIGGKTILSDTEYKRIAELSRRTDDQKNDLIIYDFVTS